MLYNRIKHAQSCCFKTLLPLTAKSAIFMDIAAAAAAANSILVLKTTSDQTHISFLCNRNPISRPTFLTSVKRPLIAYSLNAVSTATTNVGLSKTFRKLKQQGKVLLTAPAMPRERMKAIVDASQGFVYLVAATRVNGAHPFVSPKVQGGLKDIKQKTRKPVTVGFGIAKPEHVKQVAGWGADGVIVRRAMVRILGEAKISRTRT